MPASDGGITLVLGSGGARGLAHIGVLKCLQEYGVPVRAVAGTSIGAFVGGLYASGMSALDMVEVIVSMHTLRVTKILLPGLSSSGLISAPSVRKFVASLTGPCRIEDLPIPFRAVATDLMTGEGIVFDRGPLVEAILASIAIPGLLQPVLNDGRYLIDGGLSNPVPVSVAAGLSSGLTVAVDVTPNPSRLRARIGERIAKRDAPGKRRVVPAWLNEAMKAGRYPRLNRTLRRVPVRSRTPRSPYYPTAFRVSMQAISISAHNLIQLQLQRTPPDLLIDPAVEEFDMLDFHKGAALIRCGYDAARAAMPSLLRLL
ncbi:MAG: patatin-like phospholipase family protein [Ignavibacteriae bacterium]|nr:patatin-like phospholipase family protein [Ignavibacteriota bacterium]